MSFSGHIFDMIRRDKEYRDMRNLRRERFKKHQGKYIGSKGSSENPNISLEELEQINLQLKERETKEINYIFRTKTAIYVLMLIAILLIWGVYAFLYS